jgi:hypothetical protein
MIGRALGIGVRVLGRIAGQRVAAPAHSAAAPVEVHPAIPAGGTRERNRATGQAAARATVQAGQAVSRGAGGFFRPFRRVGGILWLEVTGVFFLLFALVFARGLWQAIVDYPHTSDHRPLWITAGVIAVFLYLGVSSFWRAHRRSLRG